MASCSHRQKPSKFLSDNFKQKHTAFLPISPVAVFLFSLFVLLLQNYECSAHHQDIPDNPLDENEKQALLKLYDLPHTTNNFTWNLSEPACSWKGVYCYSYDNFTTVLHLRLPGKSFVGQIPPDTIGKLTSLRVLSLRVNGFYGELPPDFANLTSLTRLSLNNNSFSGTIPSYFSTFTKLNILALNNNSFSGYLPDIKAKDLEIFDVSSNKLNSRIPPSLSRFNISAFSQNVFLCGPPTKNKCNSSYPDPPIEEKKYNMTPLIVCISIGSALVLLVLFAHIRKKVYNQEPKKYPLKDGEGEGNGFVLFDEGIRMRDMEELLKASAVVLGEGSVGRSYKRVLEGENTTVVVKKLKDVVVTENEFRKTMEDLDKMKNKNVVRLLAYYYSKYEKWLVYEYMPGGSLYDRLHGSIASKRPLLDWDHRMRIALSSARGLEYLHAENVIHGNIKSSNILIQQETNGEASVADYGLNTLFRGSSSPNDQESSKVCDTKFQSDVYSFGVLLLELLTGQIPKQDSSDKEGVPFSNWVESNVFKQPHDIYDVEHNFEGRMELFEIAKSCVSSVPDQNSMRVVVSKIEMWFRQSSDGHSKGYDDTPSTET